MTIKKKESSQLNILDWLQQAAELASQTENGPTTGSLSIEAEFKEALAQDLKHARDTGGRELSRYEVAGLMSKYLDRDVTKEMLDNWTARSHPHNMPSTFMPAFRLATGGRRAFEVLSRHAGLFALPGPEALRAEIQKLKESNKRNNREIKKREVLLEELERD